MPARNPPEGANCTKAKSWVDGGPVPQNYLHIIILHRITGAEYMSMPAKKNITLSFGE
jgi:hypothetical protein